MMDGGGVIALEVLRIPGSGATKENKEKRDADCGRIDLCRRGFTVRDEPCVVADPRSQGGHTASGGCADTRCGAGKSCLEELLDQGI